MDDDHADLLLDLAGLFLAVPARALRPVEAALRRLPEQDPPPPPPGATPPVLAAAVERAIRHHAAGGGFGAAQPDLAAAALREAGHAPPAEATLAELEALVLDRLGQGETTPLGGLALAVARLRAPLLARARRMRLPLSAPIYRQETGREGPRVQDWFSAIGQVIGQAPLLVDFQKQAEQERQRMGKVNILLAGKTGVGKSTLVNAVFGAAVAQTGMGRPVTQGIAWFEPPHLPVRLCDTKGLEMEAFQPTLAALEAEIERGNASRQFDQRIHLLWLCISEPGTRVEEGERQVAKLCARHGIPAVVILTKAIGPRAFQETVRAEIPEARHIVRVLAEAWEERAPFGLPELIAATEQVLPEARQAAFIAAQQVDLERKRRRALKLAAGAAASAAAAAAVPVPVADAAGIFAVNVGMVAAIAVAMGVAMDRDNMLALAASLAGALATSAGGRMVAGQVLKLIPGVGSLLGGAITATIAASTTYGLGYGFTEYLCRFHAAKGHMPEGDELKEGFRRFWESWGEKAKAPPA
ncbi:GTP-binding DUF697 domain-containing protein [Roseomonas sp. GC11]|uniref:DUF697 domain-containing protein n=1 Tax=Roseomonas sp. GC11 TaxID=2950546 RepID=UPI00210BC72B|nr:DUF697 domain-containing protein [Roseomonas sp. GC11]MCQ4161146.1 GTP-binding DUF697 domain-containing protein [Roseomonas sp. GC11]